MNNPKNSLDHIYNELGNNICLYPFFGAFYQTNKVVNGNKNEHNSVRPCSLITYPYKIVTDWDITDNSIYNTRNNAAWKRMRQSFLDGKFQEIPECQVCINNECHGTTSPRMMNNKFYSDMLSIDIVEEVKKIAVTNEVTEVRSLDYYPSNYCNYSCIMCTGGASTQRLTYEIKVLKKYGDKQKLVLNPADPDFFDILKTVEIINFTGGETILQKQVIETIDYLIEQDLAKNITITLLTNASSYPDTLQEKFAKFKSVIYTVSIDGIGDVIEYQRRGAVWSDVEKNSLKLLKTGSAVVNYVITAVNVLSAMDFINWAYKNNIGPTRHPDQEYIFISPVNGTDDIHPCLSVNTLPTELKELALSRLTEGRKFYADINNKFFLKIIDRFISILNNADTMPELLPRFIEHITKEDSVSKKKLIEVVPEWAPYFTNEP